MPSPVLENTTAESCPHSFCDGEVDKSTGTCTECGRHLVPCRASGCSAWCRVGTVFCRHCGEPQELRSDWPQEGLDETRSYLRADSFSEMSCRWSYPAAPSRGNPPAHPVPAPVLYDRHILFFCPSVESAEPERAGRQQEQELLGREDVGVGFAAISLAEAGKVEKDEKGEPIAKKVAADWFCPMFRQDLGFESSPVVHGPFAYVATRDSVLLHRIELSEGERRVCEVVVDGQEKAGPDGPQEDLPVEILPGVPPVLLKGRRTSAGAAEESDRLVILSEQEMLLVALPNDYRNSSAQLAARSIPIGVPGERHLWSRPVRIGDRLLSTSRNGREVFVIDIDSLHTISRIQPEALSRYHLPEGFSTQSAPSVGVLSLLDRGTPCCCWYASDHDARRSRLIMFQSPGGFRHVDIRYTGPFGEPDRAVYGPAMDGSSVYLPALVAEHPEAYGVTSYSGDLEPSSIDLPGPGLTPYHHCICQDCLLLPSGDGVAVFRPYKSHAALEAQQAFRGGVPIVAAGRPIMDPAKEHLYMPVPDGISCFQFL